MPGSPQKGIKTPCIIPGFHLLLSQRCFCNPHTLAGTSSARCVFSLFMSISVCVYMWSAHVLCVYMHVTELSVYASPLSSGVPNWLWHICGFSRQIRAGAKLPRNQCNRLRSPPFPSYSSLSLDFSLPPSFCLSLSLPLSLLLPFFSLCLAQSPY